MGGNDEMNDDRNGQEIGDFRGRLIEEGLEVNWSARELNFVVRNE